MYGLVRLRDHLTLKGDRKLHASDHDTVCTRWQWTSELKKHVAYECSANVRGNNTTLHNTSEESRRYEARSLYS